MLIGRSGNLSIQAETDLRQSGLSHILAVSGMHCSFLMLLLAFFALGHKRHLALWGIPALIFYAVLTGASPSVVRGLCDGMLCHALTAAASGQRPLSQPFPRRCS